MPSRLDHFSPHVFIRPAGTTGGRAPNQSLGEDNASWAWAVIETPRHTGVRAEELTELTHLAPVSHRLADTGEVVPLLRIVPSKSNEERLLVSPESADVLPSIVRRLRGPGGAIPLAPSYDVREKVWNPPMPLPFQRKIGTEHRAFTPTFSSIGATGSGRPWTLASPSRVVIDEPAKVGYRVTLKQDRQ